MKRIITFLFLFCLLLQNSLAQTTIDYGSNEEAGRYAKVNDIKVYYEVYGEGDPLLLIHGNGGSIENFSYQLPAFSKHFKVIAVDSRAQGRTTDSDQEITYAIMASDMAVLIEKLKLNSVFVVGWSDGGNVGLELAFAYPEKVKKLVTIGANFVADSTAVPFLFSGIPQNETLSDLDSNQMKLKEWCRKNVTENPSKLSPHPERLPIIQKKLSDLMINYPNFTVEQLARIDCPTLVIAGDHDLIRDEHSLKLFHALQNAQLCIIPGSSHLVPAEKPVLVNNIIITFLETPYRDIDRYYFLRGLW